MKTNARRFSTTTIAGLCFLIAVVWAQGAACTAPPLRVLDADSDGIMDDGDNSGLAGDNPCTDGDITVCDDNCPRVANRGQADSDGDGAGDACDPEPEDPDIGGRRGRGGSGGGGGDRGFDGNGDEGGGSGGGSASTIVYLNQGAALGWTSIEPCSIQESEAGTATGSTSIQGSFATIEQELSLPEGSAGTAYVECRAASEFTVQADPNEPADPTAPPLSEVGWIVFEAAHLAGPMDASNYAIVFLVDVLGADPASPLEQFGYAYGDTVSPPLAFPATGNYDAQVPVVLREGQTYSVKVLVRSGFGSAGADFGEYYGGNIDFTFNIGELRADFGFPE